MASLPCISTQGLARLAFGETGMLSGLLDSALGNQGHKTKRRGRKGHREETQRGVPNESHCSRSAITLRPPRLRVEKPRTKY
jgi:hypothetical protein